MNLIGTKFIYDGIVYKVHRKWDQTGEQVTVLWGASPVNKQILHGKKEVFTSEEILKAEIPIQFGFQAYKELMQPHTVIMTSVDYGSEKFEYDTLIEATIGLHRLMKNASIRTEQENECTRWFTLKRTDRMQEENILDDEELEWRPYILDYDGEERPISELDTGTFIKLPPSQDEETP